jgi:hypothetical protein
MKNPFFLRNCTFRAFSSFTFLPFVTGTLVRSDNKPKLPLLLGIQLGIRITHITVIILRQQVFDHVLYRVFVVPPTFDARGHLTVAIREFDLVRLDWIEASTRTVLGNENNVLTSAEVGRSVCATHDNVS